MKNVGCGDFLGGSSFWGRETREGRREGLKKKTTNKKEQEKTKKKQRKTHQNIEKTKRAGNYLGKKIKIKKINK